MAEAEAVGVAEGEEGDVASLIIEFMSHCQHMQGFELTGSYT